MNIYRDMSQESIDRQYNVRGGIPDYLEIFKRWATVSDAFRKSHTVLEGLPYGTQPLQTLDLFPAKGAGAPLLVFIHGGYWQSLDKSDFSFVAAPYLAHGISVAVVNYRLAPQASMDDIVADNRAAFVWLYRNAARFELDRSRFFVSGHSAGGHLTATMAGTDWVEYDLPPDVLKGGCAISGLYDLEPIRCCYLNKVLGLTPEQVAHHSPQRHPPARPLPMILTVGGAESDEYHRLQRDYEALLRQRNVPVSVVPQRDGHHFDVVDRLGSEGDPLAQAVLAMIGRC